MLGVIDEVVYYGDMIYYDVWLDCLVSGDGCVCLVWIVMCNVFGCDVQDVGMCMNVSWLFGLLVFFC